MLNPDSPLRLSARLVSAGSGEPELVEHAVLRTRAFLTAEDWNLLELFRQPATPRQAFGAHAAPELFDALRRFVDLGFLTPPDEESYLYDRGLAIFERHQPLVVAPAAGLFGAGPDPSEADFVVTGVPFDRASTRVGSAEAPQALRLLSAETPMRTGAQDGRLLGLRDSASARLRLAGVRLCDLGDVEFLFWENLEPSHGRICRAGQEASSHGGVPVFLGGDHSITEPLFRGVAREPLFLVHLDAHRDLDEASSQVPAHHGCFVDRLRRHPMVAGILQIGVRDVSPPWLEAASDVPFLGAQQVRRMSVAEIVAAIPARPCYVSIDIDVIDPAEAPGTGTPLPAGLPVWLVEDLLEAIGLEREVRAFDLVEVSPPLDRGRITQWAALRLLLTFLDAIHRRRAR